MQEKYDPGKIEPKWQDKWNKSGIYKTKDLAEKPKFYALDFFPYPSGAGLHVGHTKGYTATDAVSRMKMMEGFNVLHPMGWDAFGLPAENYAIKNKIHPRISTEKNVAVFKEQLGKIGFTYDWDREIDTTDPEFYKWTQWIFLKMFERGMAYQSDEPVNWCPSCKTVLANEDLEAGLCERCGTQVVQKKMKQWVLKMTAYADRLLYDLDRKDLEWEDLIKEQQKNWIGRSEGATVKFQITNDKLQTKHKDQNINPKNFFEVFTTRLDTIFGCTYCVVAPEHKLIAELKEKIENYEEVEKYMIAAQNKTEIERAALDKEKTGVELKGIKAINPFTGEEIPVWVADYVLGFYGTGAVMAVPAHDERDFEFAKKYALSVKVAVFKQDSESRSFVMGIDENKLKEIGVSVLEKTEQGFLKIKIPYEKLEEYKILVRETMESGFWNEFSTKNGFYFIFKHKDGHIEEMGLSEKTNDLIDKYGAEFNNEKVPEKPQNVYSWSSWISKDAFYHELLIHTDDGILINSGGYTGLTSAKAREEMTKWLEEKNIGKRKVNYKMRDWVFSRQRYWGEPIPIIHCAKCGAVGVPEKDLPVMLPDVKSYEPTGTGESPLANITEWVNVPCPKCGGAARRETNTMPQWAGSSWYYLRFIDPKNSQELVNKEKEKYWMPVDLYVGGAEHATRHLLYARFWHKFLFDLGAVSTEEPFRKLFHVGLILAEDGRKMSKRWGNVINPDDVIREFGADSFRLYEMFMGPFSQSVNWSTKGVVGMKRFLERVWGINSKLQTLNAERNTNLKNEDKKLERLLHKTIKKVGEDIDNFKFNTAISALMILSNEMEKSVSGESASGGEKTIPKEYFEKLLILLSPFTPHIAEELWSEIGNKESIFLSRWPEYDKNLIKEDEIEMLLQVNGKLRDKIKALADISEEEAKKLAFESEKVKKEISGKEIKKVIFVKGRLINVVI